MRELYWVALLSISYAVPTTSGKALMTDESYDYRWKALDRMIAQPKPRPVTMNDGQNSLYDLEQFVCLFLAVAIHMSYCFTLI